MPCLIFEASVSKDTILNIRNSYNLQSKSIGEGENRRIQISRNDE